MGLISQKTGTGQVQSDARIASMGLDNEND